MLDGALSYLAAQQGADGAWGDFIFSVGHSTDWISGYVGQTLVPYSSQHPRLKRTMQWLLETEVKGEWGYNTLCPHNADATANIGLFLWNFARQAQEITLPDELFNAITSQLQRYQHSDGGFSTYIESLDDIIEQHWLDSHVEITATCGRYLLLAAGSMTDSICAALEFLMKHRTNEGFWHAYWYEGPLYSTNQVLKFIKEAVQIGWACEDIRTNIRQTLAFVLQMQKDDGRWALYPELPSEKAEAISTALALDILMNGLAILLAPASGERPDVNKIPVFEQGWFGSLSQAISRGLIWLQRTQEDDGSWPSSYILRTPDSSCAHPWLTRFPQASYAKANHVACDQQRNFTVATVIHMFNTLKSLPFLSGLQSEVLK
jgi:squalene cyclase